MQATGSDTAKKLERAMAGAQYNLLYDAPANPDQDQHMPRASPDQQ